MEDILLKIDAIQQALDLLLEASKGGPGSGRRPSGPLTDPNHREPIRIPASNIPKIDDERIVVRPGKPIRLR